MEDQVNMAIGLIKERMASGMAPRILEIPADLKKFMDEKNLLQKKTAKIFFCVMVNG